MTIAPEPDLEAPEAAKFFAGYKPPADVYDEIKDAAGRVRPHWHPFVEKLDGMGREGLGERQEAAQQVLRDHGVSFNVSADGRSDERPWRLDMLPLLISAAEWARIEAGLIQRARLLNLVLEDIYGPQRLLRDGLLPPAMLHANPGFIRPCHGIRPPDGRFLSLMAVDLTRAPNGEWWVLGDRTQAPSGLGYSMENRFILSRVMADEFQEMNVERIASFFLARQEGFRSMAPERGRHNVVLLTPGPRTQTYFEHAYLARYFGHPLVEGSDLTVRDRKVYVKTIDGLQPVDVIIRRVDDTFCDPLELRSDSFLGVPGLVEAARAGNVAISTPLGAGAVEATALLAFLPALARHLLGEQLMIPNVATWWFGQARERAYALGRLRSLVVKRAFVQGRGEPKFGELLDEQALEALAARIREHPHDFVGQERVALSTMAVINNGKLEPRPLILRCFVGSTAGGYTVMRGGLTRVSGSTGSPIVTSTHGGGSKDTWILSTKPPEDLTLHEIRWVSHESRRALAPLPSRAVDNLFWLGRYAERLEHHTRLLRTVLSRMAGEEGPGEEGQLTAMLGCMVRMGKLPPGFAGRVRMSELAAAVRDLIFDNDRAFSLRQLLGRMSYLIASLRDRFSGDAWRVLNQIQSEFPTQTLHFRAGSMISPLHRLVFQLAAFSGMEMENMARGHAWRFLEIGRRIERATNLLDMVRAMIEIDPAGGPGLIPLLECCDSTMSYHRRYFSRPELPETLDLLVADETNPRAIAFQLLALGGHLADLPGMEPAMRERQELDAMASLLEAAEVSDLGAASCAGETEELHEFLQGLHDGCWAISDALTARYFSHVIPQAH